LGLRFGVGVGVWGLGFEAWVLPGAALGGVGGPMRYSPRHRGAVIQSPGVRRVEVLHHLFQVQALGFRVSNIGFRVWGLGFRV
jgi:hypothetical protein